MIDITEGELTVDGTDVSKLSGKALRKFRRKIGMIFQSFNLVTRATALKNVLTSMVPDMGFFRVLFGLFTEEQKLAALAALDKVGILDKGPTSAATSSPAASSASRSPARSTRIPPSSSPTSRLPRSTR